MRSAADNIRFLLPAVAALTALVGFVACGNGEQGGDAAEVKAPHFIDSTPTHGQILAAAPINAVVNTDFDLMDGSTMQVLLDGDEDYGEGAATIDDNRLALRRAVREEAPDGTYLVTYHACWPDGSCHDGQFGFEVNRSGSADYEDLRGRADVMVSMENIQFSSARIIVSPGTRIVWTNRENVEHFVNTDSHPFPYLLSDPKFARSSGGRYLCCHLGQTRGVPLPLQRPLSAGDGRHCDSGGGRGFSLAGGVT